MPKFFITGTIACHYCKLAEQLLLGHDIPFEKTVLDTDDKKARFKALGYTTVPQIWHQKDRQSPVEYVGGYTELMTFIAREYPS